MGMTITEKILARAAGRDKVSPGEFLTCKVDQVAGHDLQAKQVLTQVKNLGVKKVPNPDRLAIVFDHQAPAHSVKLADLHASVRTLAGELGVTNVFDVGSGIMHVVVPSEGFVLPGEVVVINESHAPTSGALGAVVMGGGASDGVAAIVSGEIWLVVPETIRINLHGKLPKGATAKDLGLKLMALLGYEVQAVYKTVEIGGPGMAAFSMDSRFTLTNLCADMGAKSAIIEPDEVTLAYLKGRAKRPFTPVYSDPDCSYSAVHDIQLEELEPLVSCPHSVENVKPVTSVAGTKIDEAVIGTCTNGRIEDMRVAAEFLGDRRVAPGVRLIVVPATKEVYLEAMRLGYLPKLIEAGALVMPAGCGPCFGEHSGVLGAGETCISAGNRNWLGRMGSEKSFVYLASPITVMASAIAGCITDPRD